MIEILQYNTHRSKEVLVPLSMSAGSDSLSIIALQEPHQHSFINSTSCPSSSPFFPLYPPTFRTRACFLIHRKLLGSQWHVEFPDPDIAILTLHLQNICITITNLYLPPLRSYTADFPDRSPLFKVPNILSRSTAHLVLGDFNVHHPSWNRPGDVSHHNAADTLLALTASQGLTLLTPPGLPTFQGRLNTSTLDLAFGSQDVASRLQECSVSFSSDHGSDHLPVRLLLDTAMNPPPAKEVYRWNTMDKDAVAAGSEHLVIPPAFTSHQEIDHYVEYLQLFIRSLIDATVPHRSYNFDLQYSRSQRAPWWTADLERMCRTERHLRRHGRVEEARELSKVKRKTLRQSRRSTFRRQLHELPSTQKGIWSLVKWAKTRSSLPPELPRVPALAESPGTPPLIMDFACQATLLARSFFPQPAPHDRSDIDEATYPEAMPMPAITEEEVRAAVKRLRAHSAPGPDEVPNCILQAMGDRLVRALTALTQACLDWQYHPRKFRTSVTVALKKPQKPDYSQPKAWRPIALLSTIGKVVEAVISNTLRTLAESHGLLPPQQMGARPGRSTVTALDLLLTQLRLGQRNKITTSVLSMDISGAFDRIHVDRLIHVLKSKRVPESITGWVRSFMSERRTVLRFNNRDSLPISITHGIPQGSPLSPILWLFYHSGLLEALSGEERGVSCLGFVDDTTLIVHGSSTTETTQKLQQLHGICLTWAAKHGAVFAPEKYALMHLTRKRAQEERMRPLDLDGFALRPVTHMRVLGLVVDSKLSFKNHCSHLESKMKSSILALTRLTGSTWGLPLLSARSVYTMVIRPMLTYASPVWLPLFKDTSSTSLSPLLLRLSRLQNKCLRVVAGAYRRTPSSLVERLCYVPPLHIQTTSIAASYRRRVHSSTFETLVSDACANIPLRRTPNLEEVEGCRHSSPTEVLWWIRWLHGTDTPFQHQQSLSSTTIRKRAVLRHWRAWVDRKDPNSRPPGPKWLQVHERLHKAESSIYTQLYTGVTGLRSFLHRIRVPGLESPACACGYRSETVEHIITHCERFSAQRRSLISRFGPVFVREWLHDAERSRALTRWWLNERILHQFHLANDLIEQWRL